MKLRDNNMCFACGEENPISLKLDFELIDGNKVETCFKPKKEHQGYGGIMHGGLVTTLLDEAMAKVLELKGIVAVTAEINVRFKKAVKIDQELQIKGLLKEKGRHKLYFTEAFIYGEEGLLASAEAKFMQVKVDD